MVPKLRFPEFQNAEAWKPKRLGTLFSQREETGGANLRLLSLTEKDGIIPQDESNRKNTTNGDLSRYLRVTAGDIAYNTMRMWEGRSALSRLEGIVSPAYTVCSPTKEANSLFFSYYFKTPQMIAQFARYSQGLVKDTLNLKFEAFARILAATPPTLAEQQKIADCLDSADALISAQGRKVEALRAHKKGLMQQLFPQEGETQPRLRFPEFEGEGEWEEKRLDKLATVQSGATPSKANAEFWGGSIPWVSAKDMKRLFLEDSEEHISEAAVSSGARLVPKGTLLLLTRGMTLIKDVPICVTSREMSFNQDVKGLRPRNGVNGLFLAWLLLGNKERLLDLVSIAGHGTGKIDTDELNAFILRIPHPPEQQRIAECLASLDDLISAEAQRLDTLKTNKKGLMQQLFPQGGESDA